MTLEQTIDAVEAATTPEDGRILEAIGEQVRHYHQWHDSRPPRQLANGKTAPAETHGFVEWLWALSEGISSLPVRLPRAFLEAWQRGYVPRWGLDGSPWCPKPLIRCESCLLVLPHLADGAERICPSCGSDRIAMSDVSRHYGERWLPPDSYLRSA